MGTTTLVAVTDQTPLVRRAVLTLYGHRRPEVGLPAEHPEPIEDSLVITDFVERVGDPVPLVAADGSARRGELLLADAVEAMTRAVSPVRRPDTTVLAVPAHWRPAAFDAIRAALPGVRVVPDSVAALTAIQAHPGIPARGVVALCDFGATGTNLTLADAAAGFVTIGQTVRYPDFSGDLLDQELLRHVLAHLDAETSGTAAVSALARLREQCRTAKERLSYQSATGLIGPLPGSTIRLTRAELEAVVAEPLGGVLDALHDLLRRNGIHPARLAALVTVGGGARIPVVTQRLSESFRMPVTTVAQAQVIAAVGARLLARRGEDETATRQALAIPTVLDVPTVAAPRPLAWSIADNVAEIADYVPASVSESATADAARPEFVFADAEPAVAVSAGAPWYRRGGVVLYAAVFLALVGTVGLVLSARADHMDAAASAGSPAPETVPAESPLAQALPAPPTRTVVVRDRVDPAPQQAAPRPAAESRLIQSGQTAPAPPGPVAPAAAPPVAQLPRIPVPQLPIPQLPIPMFVPPTATVPEPTPTPAEPTQEPAPQPTQEPAPQPTQEPAPDPTQEPDPTLEPAQTQAPEPAPEPEPEPTAQPSPEPTVTAAPEPTAPAEPQVPVTTAPPAPAG